MQYSIKPESLPAYLLLAVAAILAALHGPRIQAAGEAELLSVDINVRDIAALQRGVRTFNDYCLGCHGADYMRYKRIAGDLNYTDDQVEQALLPPGRKIIDPMTSAMTPELATEAFGKEPPNLSLSARYRGPDWLYTYLLAFYPDPSTRTGWNNLVFPNVAMPHPMWKLQGNQKLVDDGHQPSHDGDGGETDGHAGDTIISRFELVEAGLQTPEEYRKTVKDLVTFMVYLAEPAKLQRMSLGPWVLLYLVAFTLLAWWLKREYWRDVD